MNKFWKHISVWKWLKIIVSIFILMSCQKIYVEHYCDVPHIWQKLQIWHTSQECPILNLCVTGLTISITILFIITSVATFSNDMKLVPDSYIISSKILLLIFWTLWFITRHPDRWGGAWKKNCDISMWMLMTVWMRYRGDPTGVLWAPALENS